MIKANLDFFFQNSLINPYAVLLVIDFNCYTCYSSLNIDKNNINFQLHGKKYKSKRMEAIFIRQTKNIVL